MLEAKIPSADFTFRSSGDAVANYVASNTEFASAPGCNVVTNGSTTGSSNVNVVYKLVIPSDQPCNDQAFGYYSAVHTYTLVVGTP